MLATRNFDRWFRKTGLSNLEFVLMALDTGYPSQRPMGRVVWSSLYAVRAASGRSGESSLRLGMYGSCWLTHVTMCF